MRANEPPAWVVDADDAARLAALEAELARLYERLQARAPDAETSSVLERLASAARSRAQVFTQVSAEAVTQGVGEPGPYTVREARGEGLMDQWLEAVSRFEQAASESAGQGDADLDAFHDEVARVGRAIDALLVAQGGGDEDDE